MYGFEIHFVDCLLNIILKESKGRGDSFVNIFKV